MTDTQTAAEARSGSSASAGGSKVRLREYETLFLVKPDLPDEAIERIKERVRAVVAHEGGKVIKFTNWGKKKTAFVVEKQLRAIFVHVNYLGKPGLVAEIERNLAISEDVSKYMSKHLADDVDPDSRPVEPDAKLAGDEEKPRVERESAEADAAERPISDTADEGVEDLE